MSKTVLSQSTKLNNKGHSPTLKTILEIESAIKKKGYFESKTQLYRTLKNKTQYATFNTVLQYLKSSYKVEFNKDGSLVWIFVDGKNKKLIKTLKNSVKLR